VRRDYCRFQQMMFSTTIFATTACAIVAIYDVMRSAGADQPTDSQPNLTHKTKTKMLSYF